MAFDKAKSIDLANRYLQKGAVDRALREYDLILQHDPKDVRIRHKLAELLARRGRGAEAMREFQVVADAYERSGFFPKAAAIYKQMLRSDPDSIPLQLRLGEIYHQLGMRSDAAEHYRKVAVHFDKKGSVQEILDIHRKLAALNPEDLDARFKLGELYLRHGDPVGAAQLFREMAVDLERGNQADDLIRVYERLVQVEGDNLGVHRRLAGLHLARNDPRRALQRLQVCFKADPQDAETLTMLGQAFHAAGESEKAVQVYEELHRIYEESGQTELAEGVQGRLVELDPSRRPGAAVPAADLPTVIADLELDEPLSEDLARVLTEADVYVRYGLADRARSIADQAAARHPASFAVHRLRARIAATQGDAAAAVEACQGMYRAAMDRGSLDVARAALVAATLASPRDTASRDRLRAFDDAMGSHLGLGSAGDDAGMGGVPGDPMLADTFGDLDLTLGWDGGGGEVAGAGPGAGVDDDGFPEDDELFDLARALESELGEDGDDGEDGAGGETFDLGYGGEDAGPEGDDVLAATDPHDLGRSYFEVGLYDEAKGEFERAVAEGVRVAESLEMIGVCLRKKRAWDAAVGHFQQVLQGGNLDTEGMLRVLFELGVTYEARGDKASAYRVYQRLASARPDYRGGEVGHRLEGLALELGRSRS
ncbi:tetratricopeptide repeat protein [Myxococcota bacterium]|nr:tetratricopeptide repeat protein [Myxococcota bacterium]